MVALTGCEIKGSNRRLGHHAEHSFADALHESLEAFLFRPLEWMACQTANATDNARSKGVAALRHPVQGMLGPVTCLGHPPLGLELFVESGSRQSLGQTAGDLGDTVRQSEYRFLDETRRAFGNTDAQVLRSIGDQALVRLVEKVCHP